MPAKLYVVPASHPCATVEAALDRKGVAYERVDLVPVMHKLVMKGLFGASTVPGIVFEGGRKVHGSRAIVRALEEQQPEPPLFPPRGTEERKLVEEAEEWGDQVLQPIVRRLVWHALSANHAAQLSYAAESKLVPPTPDFVAKATGGVMARFERRFNGVDDTAVRADLIHLGSHLARIDRWLELGVLRADGEPTAADLQIGSGIRLLQTLDDLRPKIDPRPAGAHARQWFPAYPGRTPTGAFAPAWIRGDAVAPAGT
jgi:glutathione S-transferase